MAFEVEDVLINIRQFMMNQFEGFEKQLEEYKNNKEKMRLFIKQCQYVVENGWDDEKIDNTIDFFSNVLKPLLVNPRQNAFMGRGFPISAESTIKLFTRLALFRLLFEEHQKNPCIENSLAWFTQMNDKLNQNFQYPRTEIFSAKSLHHGKNLVWEKIKRFLISALCITILGALVRESDKKMKNFYPPLKEIMATVGFILLGLAAFTVARYMFSSYPEANCRNTLEADYRNTLFSYIESDRIISNETVKKFFLVSDDEIKALDKNEKPSVSVSSLTLS